MASIIEVIRKSPVLKHPALPCLSSYYTINLLAGCPYGCRYCYAQSFRSFSRKGSVRFYSNTVEKLRGELARKRCKPALVYYSTACEPFIPYERVLDALYQSMKILLEQSIAILISTKSSIPDRFMDLFSQYPDMVHIQMGLTTVNESIRKILEPFAAPVSVRIRTLDMLMKKGISAEIRMDPLIPELTDDMSSLCQLFASVSSHGIHRAVVSYLFLRPSLLRQIDITIGSWNFKNMVKNYYTTFIHEYCGGGHIRIPDTSFRQHKYNQIQEVAKSYDVIVGLCQCKNPDITTACCHENTFHSSQTNPQFSLL